MSIWQQRKLSACYSAQSVKRNAYLALGIDGTNTLLAVDGLHLHWVLVPLLKRRASTIQAICVKYSNALAGAV